MFGVENRRAPVNVGSAPCQRVDEFWLCSRCKAMVNAHFIRVPFSEYFDEGYLFSNASGHSVTSRSHSCRSQTPI